MYSIRPKSSPPNSCSSMAMGKEGKEEVAAAWDSNMVKSPTSKERSVDALACGKMSLRQEERSGREVESKSQQSDGAKRGEGGLVAVWGKQGGAGLDNGVIGHERVVKGEPGTA